MAIARGLVTYTAWKQPHRYIQLLWRSLRVSVILVKWMFLVTKVSIYTYYTPVLCTPHFIMGSNESKIRAIIIVLVPWFCGPPFYVVVMPSNTVTLIFLCSYHDIKHSDPELLCRCHDITWSWHSFTHRKQTKKHLPTLLTDFGMIAEGNHFNDFRKQQKI